MLAVAAVVCLIVLLAVLMRRDDGAVVADSATSAQPDQRAPKIAATPVGATPTPEVTPSPSPTPEATIAAQGTTAEAEVPLYIRIRAVIEGGCELPADTEVSFVQILAEGTDAIVEKRALSEVSEENSYELQWKDGAKGLAVVMTSPVGFVPGVGMEREVLDGLKAGPNKGTIIQASQMFDPISALSSGSPNAVILHSQGHIIPRRWPEGSDKTSRELSLVVMGKCNAAVVLELPPDAPNSAIEEVQIFSARGMLGGAIDAAARRPDIFAQPSLNYPKAGPNFEQLPGEIKVHPLYEGTYRFRIRTTDARLWTSDELVLAAGDEKRLRVEFAPAARITARVTGASSPAAEISYALRGAGNPGDHQFLGTWKPAGEGTAKDSLHETLLTVRADAPAEFIGLSGAQYSLFAMELPEGGRASAFVPIRAGEHREIVMALGARVPVTVDVVDEDGEPITEPASVIPYSNMPGARTNTFRVGANGRVVIPLMPGTYKMSAMTKDSRTEAGQTLQVVGPGNGDYCRIVLNKVGPFRGVVLDGADKPLAGVRIRANPRPGFGWSSQETAAISDPTGEFEVVVPDGPFNISAMTGTAWVNVPARAPLPAGERFVVRIETTELRGVVLDAATREPVVRATVQLAQLVDTGEDANFWNSELRFFMSTGERTDKRGEFIIKGVPVGRYAIAAFRDGGKIGGELIDVKSKDNPYIELFVQGEGATLAGTVTDEDGYPIANFSLNSLRRADGKPVLFPMGADTDAEGRYNIPDIIAGDNMTAMFSQSSQDRQPRFFLPHLAEGLNLREGEVTTYDFTAISAARLTISAVTADRIAVGGATVRLTQNGEPIMDYGLLSPGPQTTDRSGQLTFRALPGGTYRVEVTAPDGTKGSADVTLVEQESRMVEIKLE